MYAVYKRELNSYFKAPLGYIVVAVFMALASAVFGITTLKEYSADLSPFFQLLIYSLIVIVPLLTMKLFSEERKLKTEQLFMTAPVSVMSVVLGKFFAAYTLYVGCLVLMSVNLIPIVIYSSPAAGILVGCYIALLLLGAAFIAIGTFVSALTENQLAAAVLGIAVLLVLTILTVANSVIQVYSVRVVLGWFSVMSRFSPMMQGRLDLAALLYYLSLAFVFLFLTARVYNRRRI
jgi:ABC-2 type transport system permease protein